MLSAGLKRSLTSTVEMNAKLLHFGVQLLFRLCTTSSFLEKLDWTIVKPSQFSVRDHTLRFVNCQLNPEIELTF